MWKTIYASGHYGKAVALPEIRKYRYLDALKQALNRNGMLLFSDNCSPEGDDLQDIGKAAGETDPRLTIKKLDLLAFADNCLDAMGFFFVESVQYDYVARQCSKMLEEVDGVFKIELQEVPGVSGSHCIRVYIDSYFGNAGRAEINYDGAGDFIKKISLYFEGLNLIYYLKPVIGRQLGITQTNKYGLDKTYLLTYGN